MEPLGIALGVSGLIPLFKVCTQLFDLVDSSRTQGTDFEILSTMLEIERVRLCIWGQAVGFVTDDQSALDTNFPTELDDRLEDRRISAAVSDVLACMKRIFEDSHALKQQYGLQKAGDATNSPESRRESGRIALCTTFKLTLERFNSASATNQRSATLKTLQNGSSSTKRASKPWSKTCATSTTASAPCSRTSRVLRGKKSPPTSVTAWTRTNCI